MIRYQRLKDWSAPVAPLSTPFDKLHHIGAVPIAESELLLCAHYYALCVDLQGARPQLGVLLRPDMLERSLVSATGQWTGAYSPIALRCFPFRMDRAPTDDPFEDLDLAPIKPDAEQPRLLRLKDEAGAATPQLMSLHEGLKGVWTGQDGFQPGIETLLIADLLVPMRMPAGVPGGPLYTVDRRRFSQLSKQALEAISRRSFSPIDIATALTFSQSHLKEACRPVSSAPPAADSSVNATAERETSSALDLLTPWLDTSELFPGAWAADPSVWSSAAAPADSTPPATEQPVRDATASALAQ